MSKLYKISSSTSVCVSLDIRKTPTPIIEIFNKNGFCITLSENDWIELRSKWQYVKEFFKDTTPSSDKNQSSDNAYKLQLSENLYLKFSKIKDTKCLVFEQNGDHVTILEKTSKNLFHLYFCVLNTLCDLKVHINYLNHKIRLYVNFLKLQNIDFSDLQIVRKSLISSPVFNVDNTLDVELITFYLEKLIKFTNDSENYFNKSFN